jgi:Tetratricopeptide repeat
VLTAAVGRGPTLPLALFSRAIGTLDGPTTPGARDELLADDRLRPLIGRADPGSREDRVGWVHPTLRRWLDQASDADAGHRALLHAIEELAPRKRHDYSDPLHRYAAVAEAVHAWASGLHDDVIDVLRRRTSAAPRQTLAAWTDWNDRIQSDDRFSQEHRVVARANIAAFTGITGRLDEARRLLDSLVEQSPLPADHPEMLKARANRAQAAGQLKRVGEARRLFEDVLPDHVRVFGATAPETLKVRLNLSFYTSFGDRGDAGDGMARALMMANALLADQRALELDYHPDTLVNRGNIADWTGELGDASQAARDCALIVAAWQEVRRRDDVDLLRARARHAKWTARSGHVAEGRNMYRELLSDQERVLGPEHPDTRVTRQRLDALGPE